MITTRPLPECSKHPVAAFGGYEQTMNAYQVAIDEKYRFGAYGDAMLILND